MTESCRPGEWATATRDVTALLRGLPTRVVRPDAVLVDAAVFHGVEGQVRRAVGPGHAPLDVSVHASQARHLRARMDLAVIARALEDRVPFVVAKGPALAATCYSSPEQRSYVDLDILVSPGDVGKAVHRLRAAGLKLVDANWPMLTEAEVHELRMEGRSGGPVDVHWSLRPGPVEADSATEFDRLMRHSADIVVHGEAVRILGPADAVVHVAVHGAASGGHRLIWLTDLDGAIRHAAATGELGRVVAVTDAWSARPAMAVMLRRMRRTLGVEVPSELSDLMRPSPWSAVATVTDRFAPPELAGAGRSASRLVARSASSSNGDSLRAVARKGWLWWRGRKTPQISISELLDPADPRSALHPVGGDEAAEAFFEWVATAGSAERTSEALS